MQKQSFPLPPSSQGAQRELVSFHFGTPGSGPKVYLQAALHADEPPGMLVLHKLRQRLEALERDGRMLGEVILVPLANPIGLGQTFFELPFGRFDFANGINFNRNFRDLTSHLKQALAGRLGPDASRNMALIRAEMRAALAAWQPKGETEALKHRLQSMAMDADVVLDLHCDNEGLMHLYTGTALAGAVAPLSALLGAHAVLLADVSGGDPFDETCGRAWWELAAHFGPDTPIPCACLAVTVELRGQVEVSHPLAERDSAALLAYLRHIGVVAPDAATVEPPLPAPLCQPTPLAGCEPITAPHAGLVVFLKELGEQVQAGETVADLLDPLTGESTPLKATVSGKLFARIAYRYVQRGISVAKVAGAEAFRTGDLLSL